MYKSMLDICQYVSTYCGNNLTAKDFLVLVDPKILSKLASLTSSQAKRLEKFKELAPHSKMYDLSQNADKRLRVGGDTLMTLTKSCSSIWVPSSGRCFCIMAGFGALAAVTGDMRFGSDRINQVQRQVHE